MNSIVVYLHGSAEMYGSDKVLLNVVTTLSTKDDPKPVVILNEDGVLRTAFERAGIEVHVANVAKVTRAMFSASAPLTIVRKITSALPQFDAIVAGRRVELVYTNTLTVLGGAFWARKRKYKHLWHVHEIFLSPLLVRKGFPTLVSWLADEVICNSRQTESWLLSQAPRLKARSTVVFNGIPSQLPQERTTAAAAMFRQRIGASAETTVVTVAGRLNHWKGQGLLIEAVALLKQQQSIANVVVAVVGDALAGQENLRTDLQHLVERLGLTDVVRFEPFVDDIYAVWQGSDVAVVPSTEPEPFGMVAIEAMACGLPVVAAAHGGLLDIVQDGETGVLFTPRDAEALKMALARLIADRPLAKRLGAAGQQRQLDLFSLATQVRSIRAVCSKLGSA